MSKNLFTKFFVFLLVVGLLFAALPTGQAEAATYTTWVAQVPAAPTAADTVRIWMNSDTVSGETAGVNYRIGSTYSLVYGTYDNVSYPGANWYADIPAQPAGSFVEYELFTRNEFGSNYGWTGMIKSYTVAVAPVQNTTQGTVFNTIQAAINAASAGDVIEVAPGTYNEAIEINKSNITLVSTAGADSTTINAGGAMAGIGFGTYDNLGTITIDGFTVTNFTDLGIAQSMWRPNFVVHVLKNKVIATNNFMRNGINIAGSGSTIIGNTVVGATYNNADYGSSAIIAVNGSNILIQGNTISGTPDYGITVQNYDKTAGMTGSVVKNNSVAGADYGVVVAGSDTLTIDPVTLTGNTFTNMPISVTLTNSGFMDLNAALTANTFPAGSAVVGNNIMIPLVFNGNVSGNLATSNEGVVTGTLTGAYTLNITGQVSEYSENSATFSGTVTGDIVGDITASINAMGVDTLAGYITNAGASLPVRILGIFPQSGTKGDFTGQIITGTVPPLATSMTMTSAGDASTVIAGQTLQLGVVIDPTTAAYGQWSTWEPEAQLPKTGSTVDQNGLLTAGANPGTVVVIAKALDGSLLDAQKTITIQEVPPATKLLMDPATYATTDSCTGIYEAYVNVVDVTDLVAYSLSLTYDADLITVTNVENVGFVGGTAEPLNTFADGNIKFGWSVMGGAGEPATITGNKSLIKITFTAKGLAGAAAFTLDPVNTLLVHWDDVLPIPFEVTGGAAFDFGSVVTNTTKSPTVSYCDLAVAVLQATSGDTLRADVDFGTTARVNLNKTIIFNTNGHTITRNNAASAYDSLFYVNASGNLTVNGGGTLNSTSETATNLGAAIQIAGPIFKTAKVTLEAGTTLSGDYVSIDIYRGTFNMTGGTVTDGIVMNTGGTANITGGLVQGNDAAISSNSAYSSTIITIGGTAVIDGGDGWAIYHPQQGNLNINGGTITGATGIEMRAGTLTIAGSPEITATAGDAIFMNGNFTSGYTGLLSATISGGEFTSTGGYALHETAPATTRTSNIAVSGGRFTGSLGAVSFTTVDPLILKLTAGAYNTDPGATPDYVFEPLDTYLNTVDGYYYIETILAGRIDVLPGFNPPNLTWATDTAGTYIDFTGDIPWYPADPAAGRTQGNRVAVMITEPLEGYDPAVATLTIGTQTPWVWNDIRTVDGWVDVWQKIRTVPQETLMVLKWNNVSTQTFPVRVLLGSVLLPPPAPVITSTDIQGYYLVGDPQEFHVTLTNPTPGAIYAHVIFKVSVAADAGDLSLRYWDGSAFLDLPLTCADGTCTTYYGPATGFPIDPGYTATSLFELTAAVAGSYPFTITLEDLDTDPDTVLATYTNTGVVYDKAVVEISGDPYYIVGVEGDFAVTVTNPATGKFYNNTAAFDVVIDGHLKADITAITCTYTPPIGDPVTYDLLSTMVDMDTNDDGTADSMKGRIGGMDGFFIIPNGASGTIPCKITYATAGTYPSHSEMVDVVSGLPERVVSTNVAKTAIVYAAPAITATFPTGPYTAGEPVTVPVTITNPGGIPGPFVLILDLPAGTTIVYNGITYTCTDAGCPPIPVTLPLTDADLIITFDEGWTGDIGMSLYDTSWDPDRLLATFTQEDVTVLGAFDVTGTVTMQGRTTRAGVPLSLTGPTGFAYGPYLATSNDLTIGNYSFSAVAAQTYNFSTNQPRYLNIGNIPGDVNGLTKTVTVDGVKTLSPLWLRGGNAIWTDNLIDDLDLGKITSGYTAGIILHPDADVNFDNKINIQDLALVGGNYDLTSAAAYLDWLP